MSEQTKAAIVECPECGHPSDQQPGHRLDCPTIKPVPPRMRLLPADHVHQWEFLRTDEDWFDGDETDVYRCVADGCDARDKRYIPR